MDTDRKREFQIQNSEFHKNALRTLRLCVWIALLGCFVVSHAQQPKAPPEKLDLKTATVEQLDKLPEVGPALAKAIVRFREKSGPFRRVEDLLAVPGISKRRLEKIRPFVEVRAQKSELRKNPT